MTDQKTIDSVKTSLYAAVGAGDVVVQAVADVVAQVRSRAESTQGDVEERVGGAKERIAGLQEEVTEGVENLRDRLAGLPSELPEELAELREKFTADELRKVAEEYADAAQSTYNKLVERGEAALERLRNQPAIEEAAERAEEYIDQAVELTQASLGTVASQTRAVGERAAKLVGVELPGKVEGAAAPVKAAAKKAPAKKAPAKKVVPAKKAPAAKKVPAKKVTQK